MKKQIFLATTLILAFILCGAVSASDNSNTDSMEDPMTSAVSAGAPLSDSQLQVDVYDNPDPVVAGNIVTYSTWIWNKGSTGTFAVSADLPAELTNPEYSTDYGGTWSPYTSGQQISTDTIWSGAQMQGPSFRGTVNPSTSDGVQITAIFNGYVGGTQDSQTPVITTVTKPPQVIAIYTSDNPDPVVAGNKVTYNTWINNLGDSYVNDVSISVNLPNELTNLEYSTDGQNWQPYNSGDPITFGNLFPYVYIQGPSFRGTVSPSTQSGAVLTATFIGLVGGTQNTQSSAATTVTKPPQILDLNVYDNPDPVAAGGQVTYNTWITNNGDDAASFTVSADLPAELTNTEYYDSNSQSWQPYTGQQISTGYINPGWNVAGPSFRGTVNPSTPPGSITGTFIGYVSGTANVQTTATTTIIGNNAPIANAGGPYYGKEGSPILFNAGESYDPDGDPILFRWDFNNDGIWDTDYSISPLSSHTWTDDYTGTLVVEVSDGQVASTATSTVTVENVPPTATIDNSYYVKVPITMRIAGQPTNSVEIQIIQDGQVIASGKIVRTPGSPIEQELTIYAKIDLSKPYTGKLIFDTGDVQSG